MKIIFFIKGKGEKERIVPMMPYIKKGIENYLEACPKEIISGEALFIGKRFSRLSPRIIQYALEKIRTALSLPETATPHCPKTQLCYSFVRFRW